jgi:peptidoglycan/LPS O-acetylase OafA/YrhL
MAEKQVSHKHLLLDLIRGISALLVFVSHARAAFFVEYAHSDQKNLLIKAFYLLTGLGHESVMIFFVLSGYFVGGSILSKKEKFSWKSYLLARMTRLLVVLVPALIITALFDVMTKNIAPAIIDGRLQSAWHSGPGPLGTPQAWSISPLTLLGNLAFLQTILVPVFGTNGPLWSLANEFWYYLMFPLLMTAFGVIKCNSQLKRFIASLSVALIVYMAPHILLGALIWSMGVMIWLAEKQMQSKASLVGRTTFIVLSSFLLLITLGAMILSKLEVLSNAKADLCIGVVFSICALVIILARFRMSGALGKVSLWLSDTSYSLYLFHFPAIIYASALLFGGILFQVSLKKILVVSCVCLIIILLGWLFWWIFERRTQDIKKIIIAKIK